MVYLEQREKVYRAKRQMFIINSKSKWLVMSDNRHKVIKKFKSKKQAEEWLAELLRKMNYDTKRDQT